MTQINIAHVIPFQVLTAADVPVSGAVAADFSYALRNAASADKSSLLTITELVETPSLGRYYASMTPDSAGDWSVWLQYSSGSDVLFSYSGGFTVSVGDVLETATTDNLTYMVTRCRTQYDQLAVGVSQYITYKVRTDGEWVSFIDDAIDSFNGVPPIFTTYTITSLPAPFRHYIKEHAVINALLADEIFEAQKHFIYNDNGISFTRDRGGKFSAARTSMLQAWFTAIQMIKKTIGFASIRPKGAFSSITGYPRSLDRALRGTRKFSR